MSETTFGPFQIPDRLLLDSSVELRFLRHMGPHGTSERLAHEQFLSAVDELRFAIHRRPDGVRVGRIHIRITEEPNIVETIGHLGYAVEEPFRGNGYATSAIRLIAHVGQHLNVQCLTVFVEPGNFASRRALERAGFQLVDTIKTSPILLDSGIGLIICRYVIGT